MRRHYSTTGLDPRTENLVGQPFERWTVIAFDRYRRYAAYWICQCECGTIRSIRAANLKNGQSLSCECLKNERAAETHTTHGKFYTPEHTSWNQMIQRCHNPDNPSYPRYGGRGIFVCAEWRDSFQHFYDDMGPRPSLEHSLERIDNDKGYAPENCRWATRLEQNRNRRSNHMIPFQGRMQCLMAWAEELGIKRSTLGQRLRRGESIEEALTRPVAPQGTYHPRKTHKQ